MTGKYEHVLGFVYSHPWALDASMRAELARILARRIIGQDATPDEIAAALVQRKNLPQPARGGGVAVIPIYGVIAPRMNMLSEFSGGTTFEQLTAQLRAAVANPEIATIVFDVNSPGGNAAGASEFAHEVMKARTKKPVIAQAEYQMASAAFWPMACATEIVASPSAMVGSIGIYTIHEDITEALAKLGVKQDVVSAGKYKTEGIGALSDEARAHVQALVDGHYARMVGDIAKGRGVPVATVRGGYGEGRVVDADTALATGMIDRIGTLDDTFARVLTAKAAPRSTSTAAAATDQEPVTATSKEPVLSDALWQNATFGALAELDL